MTYFSIKYDLFQYKVHMTYFSVLMTVSIIYCIVIIYVPSLKELQTDFQVNLKNVFYYTK